jgi:hypothetical protein
MDDRRKNRKLGGLTCPQIAEARIIKVVEFHRNDFFRSIGLSKFGGLPAHSRIAPSM